MNDELENYNICPFKLGDLVDFDVYNNFNENYGDWVNFLYDKSITHLKDFPKDDYPLLIKKMYKEKFNKLFDDTNCETTLKCFDELIQKCESWPLNDFIRYLSNPLRKILNNKIYISKYGPINYSVEHLVKTKIEKELSKNHL